MIQSLYRLARSACRLSNFVVTRKSRPCASPPGGFFMEQRLKNEMAIGNRFGKLLVIGLAGRAKNRNIIFHVRCDCGTIKTVQSGNVRAGKIISCGCIRKERAAQNFLSRFWGYVDKRGIDECWPWTGLTNDSGYGLFAVARCRSVRAHRFSFFLDAGTLDDPSKLVCHHCDNPPCVNPSHLFLGTHQDNFDDMIRKGRCRLMQYQQQLTHKENP